MGAVLIDVTDALCERLKNAEDRAAFEDALRLLCGWARVAEVRDWNGTWRRGGNGNGRAVMVDTLPEEVVDAAVCPLGG